MPPVPLLTLPSRLSAQRRSLDSAFGSARESAAGQHQNQQPMGSDEEDVYDEHEQQERVEAEVTRLVRSTIESRLFGIVSCPGDDVTSCIEMDNVCALLRRD